jgi:23S rRNA (cytosine1962-C5)-methyltransferase
MNQSRLNYELLDSGGLMKLERFGDRTLVRPSTLCIWERRAGEKEWRAADASYDHKNGWRFHGTEFDAWWIEDERARLKLALQNNGQIGFFPEHVSYVDLLAKRTAEPQSGADLNVLNLFAYTGLATVVCARAGARVTHVDIAKRVLDWASVNLEANEIPKDRVRFIREDARSFLAKELRRGSRYQLIIADPPGFSRISDRETWQLEEVMKELIDGCVELLAPRGTLFFSSHYYEFGEMVIANVMRDAFAKRDARSAEPELDARHLYLSEHSSGRRIPAGFLVAARAPR